MCIRDSLRPAAALQGPAPRRDRRRAHRGRHDGARGQRLGDRDPSRGGAVLRGVRALPGCVLHLLDPCRVHRRSLFPPEGSHPKQDDSNRIEELSRSRRCATDRGGRRPSACGQHHGSGSQALSVPGDPIRGEAFPRVRAVRNPEAGMPRHSCLRSTEALTSSRHRIESRCDPSDYVHHSIQWDESSMRAV